MVLLKSYTSISWTHSIPSTHFSPPTAQKHCTHCGVNFVYRKSFFFWLRRFLWRKKNHFRFGKVEELCSTDECYHAWIWVGGRRKRIFWIEFSRILSKFFNVENIEVNTLHIERYFRNNSEIKMKKYFQFLSIYTTRFTGIHGSFDKKSLDELVLVVFLRRNSAYMYRITVSLIFKHSSNFCNIGEWHVCKLTVTQTEHAIRKNHSSSNELNPNCQWSFVQLW